MKKFIVISSILLVIGLVLTLILYKEHQRKYKARNDMVAKLEQYVRDTDLADGWGESYNIYKTDYYLLSRNDVLTIIKIVKRLHLIEPQPKGSWWVRANFHVGDMTIRVGYNGLVCFGMNARPRPIFLRGNDGLEWPMSSETIRD